VGLIESGIPAFRDSAGVVGGLSIWDRYNRKPAHFQDFVAEKAARVEYWRMHVDLHAMTSRAAPNASHHIAVLLAAQGRLLGVVTQNIDGLYHRAGLDPAKLVELHGTSARARCLQCSALYPMGAIVLDIEAGEAVVPHCQAEGCGGVLKPDTVSFGQRLRHANIVRTRQWLNACDLLIVMGTSLRSGL
jgi:NAD-dependent deacetylase